MSVLRSASSALAREKGAFPLYDRDAYLAGESIRAAVGVIDTSELGAVFVVDAANTLVGILTDGDAIFALRSSIFDRRNP